MRPRFSAKLWAGRYSDLGRGRRKRITLMGYALSNLARPLIVLSASWGAPLRWSALSPVTRC